MTRAKNSIAHALQNSTHACHHHCHQRTYDYHIGSTIHCLYACVATYHPTVTVPQLQAIEQLRTKTMKTRQHQDTDNRHEIEVNYDARSKINTVISSSISEGDELIHCVVLVNPRNKGRARKMMSRVPSLRRVSSLRRPNIIGSGYSVHREGRNVSSSGTRQRRSRSFTRQSHTRDMPPADN